MIIDGSGVHIFAAEDSRWDTYMSVGVVLTNDLQGNDPFWTVVCCENQCVLYSGIVLLVRQ